MIVCYKITKIIIVLKHKGKIYFYFSILKDCELSKKINSNPQKTGFYLHMDKKIFLCPPHMGGNEQMYIKQAFDSNWIAPMGENVNLFEAALCRKLNIPENCVVALSSGTAAIHLALVNLNIKPGDEVLVSSFTFSATVNPILYMGATPVFIDSDSKTWNMDPELLENAIKDRISKGKRVKAIILVHLYGMPAQVNEIMQVAKQFDIPVIEDAAEALGSAYSGKPLGTFGTYGILSFNGNKIITTSGGGALICDNPEMADRTRFLATQARDPAPHYQHSQIGYNYRLSNILAGIGRGQMEVLDEHVNHHRYNHDYYVKAFSKIEEIQVLNEPDSNFFSNYWLTTIVFNGKKNNYKIREEIREYLEKHNIESRPLWKPMHLQPVFEQYPSYVTDVCEQLFNKGLCLPSGSSLTTADKERIVALITSMFN
jgi:dTDP-4-amino-4,6-dideoxygalactose transaminase